MKNSLSTFGASRSFAVCEMSVVAPKYMRTRQSIMISPSNVCLINVADSTSKKDTMILRNDVRGAQVCMGTCWLIVSRIVVRFVGSKMAISSRFVIKSVFVGGDGLMRGGKSERSSDSFDFGEEDRLLLAVERRE